MTLYACGGEERRGEGEGREKVRRGKPGGESSEAKGKRESEKEERREEDGKTRQDWSDPGFVQTWEDSRFQVPGGTWGSPSAPSSSPTGPQGCLSVGRRSPINSSWHREEARQVSIVPPLPRLIIYLFVFNKKLTFSVKLCTGKITIVFQVESSYHCRVLEAVIKSSSTWRYLLGWLGSEVLRWGPLFPGGRGAGARGTRRCGERRKRRGQRKRRAPGAPKGFPQSGNEPWGGAFRENVSAPQHASDLINPLGKDRGSGWRTDCGELKKLTCAAIKRAAALSDSPRATEIAPEPAAGGPGSSLPSQEKRTKRGDGLGDGPALQTLQSLETKPPLQASTSRRDKGSEEIQRPMER